MATGGNSVSYGSGSLIAVNEKLGIVITNWHVVREATGQISVVFPNGFHSPARVVKTNRDWDLAALSIWKPEITPIKLATNAPKRGEPLTIAGYGSGNYRAITGRCTQYVSPGQQLPFEMVEVSVAARQGDSGGPILNQRGELAGVLFGASSRTTTGSYVGRVRWFMDSVAVPIEDDRTMIAQRPAPSGTGARPSQSKSVGSGRSESKPSRSLAAASPQFRTPRVSAPAKADAVPTQELPSIDWRDLAGDTLFQQFKSVMALIGLFSLLAMGLRRSS